MLIKGIQYIRTKREAIEELNRLQKEINRLQSEYVREITLTGEEHNLLFARRKNEIMGYQAKINCMEAAHKAEIERLTSEISASNHITQLVHEIIHELRKEDKPS